MERNSTNENFEQFLRQNADDFRIHPSQKVWDGISENLAKRKRRFYFGLLTLLISSSVIGYTVLDFSFNKMATGTTPVTAPVINNTTASKQSIEPASKKPYISLGVLASVTKASKTKTVAANDLIAANNSLMGETPVNNSFSNSMATQKETRTVDLLSTSSSNFLGGLSANKNLFDLNSLPSIYSEEIIKPRRKASKFEMMFFFTPTVSYRNLSENKSYLRSASLIGVPYNYAALYDVNNAVTHRPNIGLELGATTKYALTKNVKLRAGLQFNINRYDIKAFKYTPERATIALNNGSSRLQTVTTSSSYRNFNGGETDWLQNFYLQLSTPIGAEVKLHGSDKMYIGVASTVQPTYVLGDRAYLITADYKNYAQVPWLIRRWNVNTNLETFVAYSTGKLKWQVGPQVRYQLLSSFVNEYPVKENLFDFGLKVGISVNQNQ
jgi:hypothetical protein